MKILILANSDLGLYKFRKELIEKLLSLDNEVYISLPYGNLVDPLISLGCHFINTPVDRRGINPITDMKLFFTYRNIISKVNPDIIISYTIKPNIYGGYASRIAHKEYVVNITGLGTAFENVGLLRTLVVSLYKIALKSVKVVFFENSYNRDLMIRLKCCKKDKTIVLNGAGVNTDYYSYQPYPNNNIFKFLFVGRVMKEKGIDELLKATKSLVSDGISCFLDIVGPCEEDYLDVLMKYEKEGWMKYHGYQEDVKPFIYSCDCFVLPSYHEGMANTNLECSSSGRPIITTNIPGCKEAVVDGESGYLCEPESFESLYEAMKKIVLTNSVERTNMGIRARKLMIDNFEKRIIVDETLRHIFAER